MGIKIEHFINPFRKSTEQSSDGIKVVVYKGKEYKQVVRKK